MVKIVQLEDAVLRRKAKEVALADIGTPKINKVIDEMKKAMDACYDGVAIAAPQIGVSLRIFVVSPKAFIPPDEEITNEKLSKFKHLVFINPKIKKLSSKTVRLDEGCLSVRGIFGKIRRSEKATVEAYDEFGNKVSRGASGLLAEVFQHETDHLDGILFVDKATDLYQMSEENNLPNKKNG
jgi:peptide deformylase